MIQHRPIFDTEKMAKHYSEKDGVPIKYVCTSAPNEYGTLAADIFYRETPHPQFGNHYFGLFMNMEHQIMITNADSIEDLEFDMVEVDGGYHYSQHRHDYHVVEDNFIDGGRAYTRTNTATKQFKVKNGEFYETDA